MTSSNYDLVNPRVRWWRFESSTKELVETIGENSVRKKKKKKLADALDVNIAAKFRPVSFAAMRIETYMDSNDVEPVGGCKVD